MYPQWMMGNAFTFGNLESLWIDGCNDDAKIEYFNGILMFEN
jgi:hypothetical protein